MLTILTLAFPFAASAAEVTSLPPQTRGDIAIDYGVTVIPDSLREGIETVGSRRSIEHLLRYRARFGLIDPIALEVELPHNASSRIRFSDSHEMVYEPVQQTGTMLDTPEIGDVDQHGFGTGGTWVRLLGTPLSEDIFSARGDQITWLVGLGYQFKDQVSYWNRNESGQRGGGPASPALEVKSFWSTSNNMSDPYVGIVWTKRFATQTNLRDTNGVVLEPNVDVQDPSSVDLKVGIEIDAWSNDAWADGLGTELAFDLGGTFSYQTASTAISGVQLPNVLSLSENTPVTRSEGSSLWANGGVRWRIIRYLDWRIHSALGAPLGRRLESPYDVATSAKGKVGWAVGTEMIFRMRDPIFDAN